MPKALHLANPGEAGRVVGLWPGHLSSYHNLFFRQQLLSFHLLNFETGFTYQFYYIICCQLIGSYSQ